MAVLTALSRVIRHHYGRRSPVLVVTLLLAPAVGLNVAVANLVFALMFREAPRVERPNRLVQRSAADAVWATNSPARRARVAPRQYRTAISRRRLRALMENSAAWIPGSGCSPPHSGCWRAC